MKTKIISSIVSCLLILGLAIPGAAFAGDTPISIRYAGSGFDTAADPDGDGLPVGVYQTSGNGTFGRSDIATTAEFTLDEGVICEDGYTIPVSMVYSASTYTFADNSQLFGVGTDGWICVNPDTGHYYGFGRGYLVNGVGRFEGMTGWYEATFDGYNLDPAVGFRSYRGVVIGGLYK